LSATEEKRDSLRLLEGLEKGGMSAMSAATLAERIDPVLFHAVVSLLRASYPATDPAATAVLDRVVKLTNSSATLVRMYKDGEQDPISRWFDSEYTYREFRGRGADLVDLLIDKIES